MIKFKVDGRELYIPNGSCVTHIIESEYSDYCYICLNDNNKYKIHLPASQVFDIIRKDTSHSDECLSIIALSVFAIVVIYALSTYF